MLRSALLLLLSACLVTGADPGRVIVVSLDGMSWQALQNDPVTQPLTGLRALLKSGAHAAGVTPHFPSTTSNSHAALWTGAWGDVNGITGNSMPVAPRSEHTAFERLSGFSSEGLRAEPIWLAAARQGVRTVAMQATQSYPFSPVTVGTDPKATLTLLNGYQTKLIAPELFLHRKDVKDEPCSSPKIRSKALCFTWMAGPVTFHGILTGDRVSVSADGESVEARAAALETEPPLHRDLARHVSPGLFLAKVPESSPAVVYFRLFDASLNDFFLYQSAIRELAVYTGGKSSPEAVEQILRDAGGFLTNGPSHPLDDPPFELGTPLWHGGDGSAERRYLEISELLIRQNILYADWLWKHSSPRLFVGYLPQPDEFEHAWKGLGAADPRYNPFRIWGYTVLNRAVEALVKMRGPGDDVVFVSDHGMAPSQHAIRINAALAEAGLLSFDGRGRVDPAKTQVVHLTNCVLINTTDWKGGIVPLDSRAAVMAKAEAALRAIRVPETGAPLITRFYDTPEDAARFGFGGPNGADLCFDYLPGYNAFDAPSGPIVGVSEPARGFHGLMPERPEMQAIMIGSGPGLPAGAEWKGVHSIDLAPLVAHLLGIQPPRDARGQLPIR